MDLPIIKKPLSTILINCDNQTVIVKVDSSKNNMKSSRHIKRQLKFVRKMRLLGLLYWIISILRRTWQIRLSRGCHVM
jgi:hypothetical protein